MPRYRVQNRITKEWALVEAPFAQEACEALGWLIGECYVKELPYTLNGAVDDHSRHENAPPVSTEQPRGDARMFLGGKDQ